jgi:hypothetical protein
MSILKNIAIFSFAALPIFAFAAGWDCTTNPPDRYENIVFGNDTWGQCYLDSAMDECQAGKMLDAPKTCDYQSVEKKVKMASNDFRRNFGCNKMTKKGWLPEGVTTSQCKIDLAEFVDHCSGAPEVKCQ